MKKNNILTIGNITTILNTIIIIISGYIIGFLTSLGLNVPFDQTGLAGVITAIIFGLFSYVNAKNHNNFWDTETDTVNIPVPLTDEQVKVIQNYINMQTGEQISINNVPAQDKVVINNREYNKYNDSQITDLDPASEYEDDM